MLKGLKGKKDGKADPNKKAKKEKEAKGESKKNQEEEEETNDALVDINYDEKEKTNINKNFKKVHASKLEEKDIDTSNINIEKKEEKKEIKSWIVEEKDIKNLLLKDYDATKHETEFVSLTNQELNKKLEEKAKQEAIENVNKPKVEEINGFKYAPLARGQAEGKDPSLVISRPDRVDVNSSYTPQIGGITANPPTFTNSKAKDFAALEKTPQQLREEETERKMQQKGGELTMKGKSVWLGSKPVDLTKPEEIKISGWATKGMMEQGNAPTKFAPLQKSSNERKYERQEQQFVFVSKKDMEERRQKREVEEAKKGQIKQ